ncbi:GntR family transcriptional regulator [Homoserinibacter sp. YIM 151385]|uniref:GntR family transcriptional regulator n=1 Tax=Homoserinibacter sp. YIM 151385 TaxID=2985506 RepID=UPI0022F0A2BE|nr:GntR family transcriptional regulator [Homoserinibacter sp. YIM 151385]WBU37159.1 GntR family transcriptional regulator [Homoserinibacter sp. YIM 151385]
MDGIRIDPGSPNAASQLREQLLARIRDGALAGGTRLPSVRALAAELGLAPGTVARSYRELEQAGAVETRGRGGTIVAWSTDAAERRLEEAAQAYAQQARDAGVAPEHAAELVRAALEGSA